MEKSFICLEHGVFSETFMDVCLVCVVYRTVLKAHGKSWKSLGHLEIQWLPSGMQDFLGSLIA